MRPIFFSRFEKVDGEDKQMLSSQLKELEVSTFLLKNANFQLEC